MSHNHNGHKPPSWLARNRTEIPKRIRAACPNLPGALVEGLTKLVENAGNSSIASINPHNTLEAIERLLRILQENDIGADSITMDSITVACGYIRRLRRKLDGKINRSSGDWDLGNWEPEAWEGY